VLNLASIHFGHVRAFRLVAETGSISKAAQELWLSQPAVSLQLRHLEEVLGCQLFEHKGNRLVLNDSGATFREFAIKLEGLLADLDSQLSLTPDATPTITIGSHPASAMVILPRILEEFHRRSPNTRVRVLDFPPAEISLRLARRELDFGLLVKRYLTDSIAAEPILIERLLLVAPKGHPITQLPQPTPQDVAAHQFVVLQADTESHTRLMQWAASYGVSIDVAMELSSDELMIEAVKRGIGLALTGESTIHQHVQSGRLVLVTVPGLPLRRTVYLTYHATAPLSEPVHTFLEIITARP
jgi:LysR family transcriptional regulator, low CO2-responsive transcriptional regulator